ncbi:MAG: aldehyde dehydrogenase (NADP(+)) [Verrucomicrobia bacterium]|nr:MAG: aldehyde dehydrogenase (NADP(+)) [Verrucomicrobiota bacterium]
MTDTLLQGLSTVAGEPVAAAGGATFHAVNPATGERLDPEYREIGDADLDRACRAAGEAGVSYRESSGSQRAALLRAIAGEIEALGETLVDRYVAETGLPRARAEGERARTCGQLRLFADLVEAGDWADIRIDRADPNRAPIPRPDTRMMLRPVGPVAVFGPANFPLAFTVAGGDTASALAAGCPVVVKAHPSHPGTSELVGRAIDTAVRRCGLPAGVFSLVHGQGRRVGAALVRHPAIRAVGFTGSKAGGRELQALCAARPEPIPFFGELSSINPICLLPEALAARPETIAAGLHGSLTLGVGQFCTNPGLVLYVPGAGADAFVDALLERLRETPPGVMLNRAIRRAYAEGLARVGGVRGVETLLAASEDCGPGGCHATPALFRADAEVFRRERVLHEEVFGPASLLVVCRDIGDMVETLLALEGQLTATVHAQPDELAAHRDLLAAMEQRAGRLVLDGFPTGVEVSASIVHGGPWPATTDVRFTSVGTAAVYRWVRPVCFQDFPQALLPEALRDRNPGHVARLVDGRRCTGDV